MSAEPAGAAENKSINKDVIEAVNLLAHGKRNILCGEISQAVTQLQEACRILGAEYGELADECADAYLWYGKALLELSRMESGVLGDAVPGVAESEESDSSEDDSSDDQNSTKESNGAEDEPEECAMSEDLEEEDTGEVREESTIGEGIPSVNGTKDTGKSNTGGAFEMENTANRTEDVAGEQDSVVGNIGKEELEKVNVIETRDVNVGETGEISATSEAGKKSVNPAGLSKSEDDDISNLQLAWEMLELSKLIYQRHDQKDMKLKLAETYLKLGEVGMETEQYDEAINDLTECLLIQQQILFAEDRRLAETLYQLGLACTYCRRYDTAVKHYHSAIAVIQAKIDRLVRIVAGEIEPSPVENSDGFYTPLELAQKEIEELRELLPDIAAKIDDVRDEQSEAEKVKILMQETVTSSVSLGSSSSQTADRSCDGASTSNFKVLSTTSAQPVNNISHLVRKKRKSEDDLQQHSDNVKRQKATADVITLEPNALKSNKDNHESQSVTSEDVGSDLSSK